MASLPEQGYRNAKVHFLKNTDELRINMKNVRDGLGVKNISNLNLKEICGIYGEKN